MSLTCIACVVMLVAAAGETGSPVDAETSVVPMPSHVPVRPGAFGLGLGIEAPLLGVLVGTAQRSELGLGYAVGAALTYNVAEYWFVRLGVAEAKALGSKAPVSYLDAGGRVRSKQDADWESFEISLGAGHVWETASRLWRPYVGADAMMMFHGFEYRFADTLKKLEAVDVALGQDCTGSACRADLHDGFALAIGGGLRGGVRFLMTRWLATQTEVSVVYGQVANETLTNTLPAREVHARREHMVTVRATFGIRVVL